ncbi:MAG: ABC transporter substrate-binding protein [Bacillota bacterium]|nr:ABC transporter substrate-binding protein [Bacillota bacterium]
MKKFLMLMLTLALAVTTLAGCGQNANNTASTGASQVKGLLNQGELSIGVDDSFPPMEFRDENNNLVGFDVDLANEIGKKLGVKIKWVPTDWNGILLSLNSKKFDIVLSSLSITDERKKQITFSDSYFDINQVIAVKNGNTSIKSSADLKGKAVGCQLGTTGDDAASKLTGLKELKKYDKATEAFHDLTIGRLDAVIIDSPVAGYYSKKGGGFSVLDEKLTKEPIGIGFRQGNTDLQQAVQKAIDELKKDGTLSKLSVKWFGVDEYK